MTQPGTVIDVICPKSGPNQLLKEIGFFVTAFCRAKSGQRLAAFFVAYFFEAVRRKIERFFPGGFTKYVRGISRINGDLGGLRDPSFSD